MADGCRRGAPEGHGGTHDWEPFELEIPQEGLHVIRWEYWKDDLDDPDLVGDNRATLDNV